MKKKLLTNLIMPFLFSCSIIADPAEHEDYPFYGFRIYPPAATAYNGEIDTSIPFLIDDTLLNNPNRGFRGEAGLMLDSGKLYCGGDPDALEYLDSEINSYSDADHVNILQIYAYLTEYHDRPIDSAGIQRLTNYFIRLKELKKKALLRFAYEYDGISYGPTTDQIISHCGQLKDWFLENEILLSETLYAVQFGMIGKWGEWHNSIHTIDKKKAVYAVLDMVPEEFCVMLRNPSFLGKLPYSVQDRIAVHDDFMVGIDHAWGFGLPRDNPNYPVVINKAKYFINDGEMPWGTDNTVENVDGKLVVKQCVDYGLTTFSLKHNYKEGTAYISQWKNLYLTEAELIEKGFPFAPFSLHDSKISIFDYLQIHLGYLLAVSNLRKTASGYEFMLTNFGLAPPVNYKILIATDEGESHVPLDLSSLIQFKSEKIRMRTEGQKLMVRIESSLNSLETIKLANSIPCHSGWNDLSGLISAGLPSD